MHGSSPTVSLGLTQNGLVPVLMPLVAANSAAAGLTYAAFSFLGLFAPLLGAWADRAPGGIATC